jgi:hypothetical protein
MLHEAARCVEKVVLAHPLLQKVTQNQLLAGTIVRMVAARPDAPLLRARVSEVIRPREQAPQLAVL